MDKNDNCIIVCSIENIDPMGTHTGDSVTIAPALTLTDKEYQVMRNASIDVDDRKIGLEVECFIYNKDFKRIPVNQSSEYSASDLLSELNKNNNNGYFSLEPGGQVEYSEILLVYFQ